MRHLAILIISLVSLSCGAPQRLLTVTNNSSVDRVEEIVEVTIEDADMYAVFTKDGEAVQCQTTYKGNLIFPVTISAGAKADYLLRRCKRVDIDTLATGRVYPEWYDDFGWENDKIAFRTYSTKLHDAGSPFYGYDIFTKRYKLPVLDILYGATYDKEYRAVIAKLKAEKKGGAANSLQTALSYHMDHGLGMDYYTVGPTLGSGTAALRYQGDIVSPGCYSECEILDRGGLRVSFKLRYKPINVGGEMVQEERIITLDRGTHFNYIEVSYKNLVKPQDVVIGIVLHDECRDSQFGDGYVAYAEPKHQYGWQTYNAVIYPEAIKSEVCYFDEPRGSARGHILSQGRYTSGSTLRYYMGAGWNRWGFKTPQSWYDHVEEKVERVKTPLTIQLK